MQYIIIIDNDALWDKVDEEVSKVADEAYGNDGSSLYDSIIVTEKDRGTVEAFIADAANAIVVRAHDICKYDGSSLVFHVPDFDTANAEAVQRELDRYLALYACSALFQQRRATVVPEYTARAQSALDKAISILKTRKAPDEW